MRPSKANRNSSVWSGGLSAISYQAMICIVVRHLCQARSPGGAKRNPGMIDGLPRVSRSLTLGAPTARPEGFTLAALACLRRLRLVYRFDAIENLAEIALGDLNIIVGLQIEPKLRRRAERLGEPKRA